MMAPLAPTARPRTAPAPGRSDLALPQCNASIACWSKPWSRKLFAVRSAAPRRHSDSGSLATPGAPAAPTHRRDASKARPISGSSHGGACAHSLRPVESRCALIHPSAPPISRRSMGASAVMAVTALKRPHIASPISTSDTSEAGPGNTSPPRMLQPPPREPSPPPSPAAVPASNSDAGPSPSAIPSHPPPACGKPELEPMDWESTGGCSLGPVPSQSWPEAPFAAPTLTADADADCLCPRP